MFSGRRRRDLAARIRRAAVSSVEALEGRQLLTYSPIGPLPDLVVNGQAGAIAAYGGPITVRLDVRNLGASSQVDPLALAQDNSTTDSSIPNSISTADAGPSHVGIYLLRNSRIKPGGKGSILIGEVPIDSVQQNGITSVTETFLLPNKPPRFPGSGGTVYIGFRADDLREVQDSDRTNNIAPSVAVGIAAPLPDLAAIALSVPPVVQPGDTIAPSIKVANYGTVNSATQGPVTVLLVASTDLNYGPTDVIIGRYQIDSLPGLSQAPQARTVLGDVTIDNPSNVITLDFTSNGEQTGTLPTGRGSYYIGVIVDPLNEIRELHEIGPGPSSRLQLVQRVNDVAGLPSAGILSDPAPITNLFPITPFAPLLSLSDFLGDASTASQAVNSTGGNNGASTFAVKAKSHKK